MAFETPSRSAPHRPARVRVAIAFHVGLLAFGWGFSLWALPMIAAFSTLLYRQHRHDRPATTVERSPAALGRAV